MATITQAVVKKVYDSLIEYCYNTLSGDAQVEGLNLCKDIKDFCLDGKWNNLSVVYQQAWLGEIIRRVEFLAPNGATVLVSNPKLTQHGLITALRSDENRQPTTIQQIYFSQFGVNRHFQGLYEGQPDWLSNREILDVAKVLRAAPEKSTDLRIRLYLQGDVWMALNNRGFALHSLANIVPRRIAFDTELSSDELSRLTKTLESMGLNFGESIPASRRDKKQWEAMIPTSVTAVPETKNSTRVIYTIRAIGMVVGAAADAGNELVYNSV